MDASTKDQAQPAHQTGEDGDAPVQHNLRRTDDLEMIQGILFGPQMEQIESRLSDLDARIDERLRSISAEMHHQINGIRKELKDKTDALNDSDTSVRSDLSALEAQLNAELAERLEGVKADVTSSSTGLLDELKTRTGDLDRRKVDRAMLATFFGETAKGLVDPGLWQENADETPVGGD